MTSASAFKSLICHVFLALALWLGVFEYVISNQNKEKRRVNMIRKCHNHTLQTNARHREEEPQNNNSHNSPGRQSIAPRSLLVIKF